MLLPGGMVLDDRPSIIEAIAGQPWSSYELEDLRTSQPLPDVCIVAYGTVASREGSAAYSALVSSTYVRREDGWGWRSTSRPHAEMTPLAARTRPVRIMVYGVTGAGKSTLAGQIADRTGLPAVFIDDLTWQLGWVPVPADEQRRIVGAVCARDRWVIDHGYGAWVDLPLARADLIVGLDYPRVLSLARLVRRCVTNLVTGRTLCNGNTESFRNLLGRDSIIWWHFTSFRRKRRRMRAWVTDPEAPPVVLFRRPRDAAAWVASLQPYG